MAIERLTEFKRCRKMCKEQLGVKEGYLKNEIVSTPKEVSIENDYSEIFSAAGWIEHFSVEKLNKSYSKGYINRKC